MSIPAQAGDALVATVTTGGTTARAGSAATASPSNISHVSCRLLVGADGANSAVQRAMQTAQPGQGWERKVWECHTGTQCWKVRAHAPQQRNFDPFTMRQCAAVTERVPFLEPELRVVCHRVHVVLAPSAACHDDGLAMPRCPLLCMLLIVISFAEPVDTP